MAKLYFRTSDIAKALGVHVNTIRNYEMWGYLPEIPRTANGYRQYTYGHLEQARLACLALQWPYLGGRVVLVELVKNAAAHEFGAAVELAYAYLAQVRVARVQAEVAVEFVEQWAAGHVLDLSPQQLTIGQTAQYLNITIDMLRNWERNGLLDVPRDPSNRYRVYGAAEFERIRVIRLLVQCGFGLMAILRLLQHLDGGQRGDLRAVLELARCESANEYIEILGDRWLSNLLEIEQRAQAIIQQINYLIELARSA